ncbi:MAG: hypothetical protein ACOX42_02380 [Clostridia bacterium]
MIRADGEGYNKINYTREAGVRNLERRIADRVQEKPPSNW